MNDKIKMVPPAELHKKAILMDSPIGKLGLCCNEEGKLTNLFLRPGILQLIPLPSGEKEPVLIEAKKQLEEYFAGNRAAFELPYRIAVSRDLLGQLLMLIQKIPYGATMTVDEIALQMPPVKGGDPSLSMAEAVRGALFFNPLPILIPCHRVIDPDSDSTYAGSPEQQKTLLALEQRYLPFLDGDAQ